MNMPSALASFGVDLNGVLQDTSSGMGVKSLQTNHISVDMLLSSGPAHCNLHSRPTSSVSSS